MRYLQNPCKLVPVKKAMKYIFLFCLTCLCLTVQSKTDTGYGLMFKSYDVEKEERTGLELTSRSPLSCGDGFILEFDIRFTQVHYNFGYILRLVTEDNRHIDLLLSRTRNSKTLEPQITSIYKSAEVLSNHLFADLKVGFDEWFHIQLMVDQRKGIYRQVVNGVAFEKQDDSFKGFDKFNIVFGKNNTPFYQTSDVPSMAVRDIRLNHLSGRQLYYWRMSEHTHEGVYDELDQRLATCENPDWIIDTHAHWKKTMSFTAGANPQICFNPQKNEVAFADKKSFFTYHIPSAVLDTVNNWSGFPSGSMANQLLFHSLDSLYFTYNFTDEADLYDAGQRTWGRQAPDPTEPVYWHHNRYFSPADNTLYTFGGYGFHLYKNDINTYHFPTKSWKRFAYEGGVRIPPRYLGALGVVDEHHLLLFGGYGTESGDQELSPHNYYDLYMFNTQTRQARKVWELNPEQHNFVVANSLVVDTLNNCFYALCFPHQKFNTFLQLYRFSLEKPEYKMLADSIPYQFNDTHSYADLYLSADKKQLVAVTSYTDEKAEKATISLYTLAYPPLNEAELYQQLAIGGRSWIWFAGLGIVVLVVGGIIYIRKRKHARPVTIVVPLATYAASGNPLLDVEKDEAYDPIGGLRPLNENDPKQTIQLFGGFQVRDKDSKVITGEFTPVLKQLFLLILLYTLKDGKGISSVKLREILWFDKSDESAKNNRGVSISKLRMIFEKIGEIAINGQNSYWTVHFGDTIYCDYYEALILMSRLDKAPTLRDIKRLVTVVSAGELLPNLQTEWVDTFKSDFSNRLIDLLLKLLSQPELELTPPMKINIADAIFAHDSLNEDALSIKCSLLVEMGKNGLARKVYDSFVKEYQALFGTDFKITFEQIIS